jgi:ubiquitin carboxyl-terminal hydrolase 7
MFKTTKDAKVDIKQNCFCGFKNAGSHCYLNSYLQLLYHIPAFRSMIINLPSTKFETKPIVSNLQRIFEELKSSKTPVSAYSLVLSFGWPLEQINSQHDVHEFSRGFLYDLEREISKYGEDKSFFRKFFGKLNTTISFKAIEPMIGEDDFADLSLSVEKSSTLEDGIKEFTDGVKMIGNSQYELEDGTKVDTFLKYSIIDFPEILHIQLNRFKNDVHFGRPIKIKKFIQCSQRLLFSRLDSLYLSAMCDYQLYGILIHSGTPTGGHYFVHLNLQMNNILYSFNDSFVERIQKPQTEEKYSEETPYVLAYIRHDCISSLFNSNLLWEHFLLTRSVSLRVINEASIC